MPSYQPTAEDVNFMNMVNHIMGGGASAPVPPVNR
jgi:hypothetical protein